MSPIRSMHCWEIMQCRGTADCPARAHPDIPCWEISEKLWTSQSVMNICIDCIVYIIKTNDPIITRGELDDIMRYRNMVRQVEGCPVNDNRPGKVQAKGK